MKRFCSLILAVLMAAMVLPMSGLAAGTYSDVSSDDWYYAAVEDATDRGLMNGTGGGKFTPDGDLTRAMLVTVLWRLNGCPAPTETTDYSDVPSGQWYSDAIAWASGFQVVEGYGGGVFGTNDPVTREQMAVIFHRWAKGNGMDVSVTDMETIPKEEADLGIYKWNETKDGTMEGGYLSANKAISDWAVEAVVWAAEHEFLTRRPVQGLDPVMGSSFYSLCAPDTATRAEVAVFLSRFSRDYLDEGSGEGEKPAATVPYTWDILTMDLPESWQGNYQADGGIGYEGVPLGRSITFWDLSNKMPRSSWGRLFDLVLWPVGVDSSLFGDWLKLGDFDYKKSGRICTVEVPGEGQLNLYVVYPETISEEGFEITYYDKENPKNYEKMAADIHDILRTIRFQEDVKVISLADALSAPLSTKTGPLP